MLIGKTEVAKMLGKRTANVRPDELRDFPKPVIERPFPKWRRWEVERWINPASQPMPQHPETDRA